MPPEKTKILLVDDDPAMLRLLAKWLEAEGYEVLRASDGRTAKELIETAQPSILVTDWEMPQADGLELVQWVRSQNFGHYIYTIFLTVRTTSADMLSGLEAGADDFLKKPVDRDELTARMRAGSRFMELEHRLSALANTDAMTGLATRRTLFDDFGREWRRAQRYSTPLSCVMLDIDFFKRVNDTYGHQAGDSVLRRIGALLAESVRASDVVGRYGGEEFCVVLPETTETQAVAWADRLRRRIAEQRFTLGGEVVSITASFGVAERLADTATAEQLVDMADQALVVAKRSGRDRVVTYQSLTQTALLDGHEDDPAKILKNVLARDVMSSIVAPLSQDHSVATAANYFLKFRIPSAPVVDDEGQLVGILSEKDLMAIMLGQDWWTTPIREVMKRNVVCYEETTPALAIFEFLSRVVIRGVVVVHQGSPTGLITRGCLLRFFINLLATRQVADVFPEVDAAASDLIGRMGNSPLQDRIAQTVRSLAAEACDMEWRLTKEDADLLPFVVGGASRMQELVIDLLAVSRFVNDTQVSLASPPIPGESLQVAAAKGLVGFQLGDTPTADSAVMDDETLARIS
jgi:diguanylate cyclase (GGDEF)-like protein